VEAGQKPLQLVRLFDSGRAGQSSKELPTCMLLYLVTSGTPPLKFEVPVPTVPMILTDVMVARGKLALQDFKRFDVGQALID
jgi:hypothetical protein